MPVEDSPRLGLTSNRHAPCGAKADQRNRRSVGPSLNMIAVRRDAIVAVAIKIQSCRIKGDSARFFDRRPHEANRLGQLGIVKRIRSDKARNIDDAIVHRPALGSPVDIFAEPVKPFAYEIGVKKRVPVDDAPGRTVGEHFSTGLRNEGQLNHADVRYSLAITDFMPLVGGWCVIRAQPTQRHPT